MSQNLGLDGWQTVHQYVNPRFSWAIPNVDKDDTLIHIEIQDPLNQGKESGSYNILKVLNMRRY